MIKFIKYSLYILLLISVVIFVYFYTGVAEITTANFNNPRPEALLNWCYVLLGLALGAALILPLFNILGDPKALKKMALNVVGIAVVCGVAYLLASGDPIQVSASVKNVTPADFKMTDTLLIITYLLSGGAIIAIVFGGIVNIIRNR